MEIVRPVRAPVAWGQMLRACVAISGPLGLGVATGHTVPGMLAATGGLLASVVDRGGPYAMRLRRILYASLFGGAAGLLIGTAIHGTSESCPEWPPSKLTEKCLRIFFSMALSISSSSASGLADGVTVGAAVAAGIGVSAEVIVAGTLAAGDPKGVAVAAEFSGGVGVCP